MSLPALAVLYASLVQKKWAVNVMAMMFAGFSIVLVVWFLYEYKMGFGANSWGDGVTNGVQNQFRQRWMDTLHRQLLGQARSDHQSTR